MAYKAMLASLEMTRFWGGIKADLEQYIGKDSMTFPYELLEYLPIGIRWEVHSECRPPLLTNNEEHPPQEFS